MSKKVLIIEDSIQNQVAAHAQLPDAVVVNYNEAFDILSNTTAYEEYCAILTDLFFIVEEERFIRPSPFSYKKNEAMIGTEQPFGIFFAMKGVELGLPTAVVTDGDHHSNLFIGLLDMFGQLRHNGDYAVGSPSIGNWISIPDPGFSMLHDSSYPRAQDMFWDELKKELVLRSVDELMKEQRDVYDALPKEVRAKTPIYQGWQSVKDWRKALATASRKKMGGDSSETIS